MHEKTRPITNLILKAAEKARRETSAEPEPDHTTRVRWPVDCTVGPGLEGAIACESKVGYVNGSKGWLIYRGYDIFDLCAHSTYEEVCFLLLHGRLPKPSEDAEFREKLIEYRYMNQTLRVLMGFPLEDMNAMAALRMGTNQMRQEFTYLDHKAAAPPRMDVIGSDEDSIPMETVPRGERNAIYEFKRRGQKNRARMSRQLDDAAGMQSAYHLISGVSTLAAAISRIHEGKLPIDPDPDLGHAANLLYMMTGRRPTAVEERVMDVALILHADHGMNASTFAALVVASTLSDVYFSVGSGIAALNGPLHGGANQQVIYTLEEVLASGDTVGWVEKTLGNRGKVMGFGHRVYKAYDPRARVLGPLAAHLAKGNPEVLPLYKVARDLEREVVKRLGRRQIFPNVDFYSGIVYSCLGLDSEMFTPIFAASRVAGWTARVLEYLHKNRIFRPRARYIGQFGNEYVPMEERG